MVQVATPTREGVEHYQNERREIEQIVSEINGVHGRLGYPAIHYLYQSLPLDELVALYRTGDVMLVTPLRDGMNLVAKEYVTTRLDGDGVLVLSEFAGAADELTDAVLVNPHDEQALREAIVTAVEMHRHERRARMARLREVVRGSDVQGWAERFLADLTSTVTRSDRRDGATARRRRPGSLAALAAALDGRCSSGSTSTACWPRSSPTPPTPGCCPGMLEAVAGLAATTPVAVVSGRTVEDLGRFGFPDHVEIFGLHGMERRVERTVELADHEEARLRAAAGAWRRRPPPRPATGRGSRSSRPASCSTSARPTPSTAPARPTSCSARPRTSRAPTSCPARASSSCSTRATSKASAVAELRAELGAGSVVFIGDDRTDEEVFVALGDGDCSIRVGPGATAARHRLAGPPEVLAFLRRLSALL